MKLYPCGNVHQTESLGGPNLWIDLEMTGLCVEKDVIMEVAVYLSWGRTNPKVAFVVDACVGLPKETLENMNDWCKENHGKTGLTADCLKSTLSLESIEDEVIAAIDLVNKDREKPLDFMLAGHSVHCDKRFIEAQMPKLHAKLSHRILDVSSLRHMRRMIPNLPTDDRERAELLAESMGNQPFDGFIHRAHYDILNSMWMYRLYLNDIHSNSSRNTAVLAAGAVGLLGGVLIQRWAAK